MEYDANIENALITFDQEAIDLAEALINGDNITEKVTAEELSEALYHLVEWGYNDYEIGMMCLHIMS